MPRKLPEHIAKVREVFTRTHPEVTWVEIDRVSETEVARRLSESAFFLSTQQWEGCPLPPLEAMACGCLVAGYPGTGHFSHPYARQVNGFWAREMDPLSAARQLGRAVQVFQEGGTRLRDMRAACCKTVQRYTKEKVVQALRHVVETVRNRAYHQAPFIPVLGFKAHYQALGILYRSGHLTLRGLIPARVRRSIRRVVPRTS
jgi:glycosyltransferase involved in cell wall biosynthesis